MTKPDTSRLYVRIADDIARKIRADELATGERLPSERLLSQEYNVSRPTIREALFALELDGLIEVKVGSGVYVRPHKPEVPTSLEAGIGPFELTEARRAIEGEACALAALRITDGELAEMAALLEEIDFGHGNVVRSEAADRQFHELIGRATQNSAMANAVETLWDARVRSREYTLMSTKAHAAGVVPIYDEHRAIYEALMARDPAAARDAMHKHISRVLNSLMLATEVREVELARERIAAQRRKFAAG